VFNFPNSPTEGQVFTDATSGAQYVYRGAVWMQSSAAQIKLSAETRNRIVNSAMQISQELTKGTTYTTTAGYPADQWRVMSTATGLAYACNDASNLGPGYITLNTTSATPSPAAGDYHMLVQPIEGLKVNDFQWGIAGARQVVLRFDALPTVAGTIGVSLRAGDNSRSYVKNVALTTGGWNTYTVVIPGDIAGTWATDNTPGVTLHFALMSGSTFIGVEGWQAGAKIGAAGMSNSVATASQPVSFRNVGLYLDPQATGAAPPFQIPDYAQELAACQRYYWKSATTRTMYVYTSNTGARYLSVGTLVPMRVIPTVAAAAVSEGTLSASGNLDVLNFAASPVTAGAQVTVNGVTASARM
jgi:hypothetical protein